MSEQTGRTTPATIATSKGTRPRPGRQAVHGDATGRAREVLQRENAEEIQRREGELTTIANQRAESINNDVVDYTDPNRPVILDTDIPIDEELAEAEAMPEKTLLTPVGQPEVFLIEEPKPRPGAKEAMRTDPDWLNEPVRFRANATVDGMTYGHGRTYDFVEGRQYQVPRYLYLHLEEKQPLWH